MTRLALYLDPLFWWVPRRRFYPNKSRRLWFWVFRSCVLCPWAKLGSFLELYGAFKNEAGNSDNVDL